MENLDFAQAKTSELQELLNEINYKNNSNISLIRRLDVIANKLKPIQEVASETNDPEVEPTTVFDYLNLQIRVMDYNDKKFSNLIEHLERVV